jgi:acetolactate synthase-1/2/3 large subunit
VNPPSAGEALLRVLAARGVRHFLGNSGTDFAAIIEAFARFEANGIDLPQPIIVPHEITAVAMAHGYAMTGGVPPFVMVHTIVGTANALGGIINADRARVPLVIAAGRTPITEAGATGARDAGIHWAQESFDQAGMVREFVRWDYELRRPEQLPAVIDRAYALASSAPAGPVYLSLPREVLAAPVPVATPGPPSRYAPAAAACPDAAAIATAVEWLLEARNPIVITRALGRDPAAVPVLVRFAERLGLPVVESWPSWFNFPHSHSLHLGFDAEPYLADVDLVCVIESDVPWFPDRGGPPAAARVIHIDEDPLYRRYPFRSFTSDLTLAGNPRLTLSAIDHALSGRRSVADTQARRARWSAEHARLRAAAEARVTRTRSESPIHPAWASHCVSAVADESTIVVTEAALEFPYAAFDRPGALFDHPPAAALGWGLGAALGAKLAHPEKTVICCVGDGSYCFGVPVSAHATARIHDLPIVVVVFNNGGWNRSRRATLAQYPDGWAARSAAMPLTELGYPIDFETVCRAAGGHGERVTDPAEFPLALARAVRSARDERCQALLNVICQKI